MADELGQSPKNWTETQVSNWLISIGVNEKYIKKLFEEEVDGEILLSLDEDFLKTKICIKLGPAHLIIKKRDELLKSQQKHQEKEKPDIANETQLEQENGPKSVQYQVASEAPSAQVHVGDLEEIQTKEDCKPRPFDQEGVDHLYVKHRVLQPESGAFNLIHPCHEFKSLTVAVGLDRPRLQAKFAKEVLKFATGCMNIRSNGTIHFGVMDSREDTGYMHGEVIGIPVKERDIYVDALNYIERSFSSDAEHVRQCVRPPRFIEVMDRESTEKMYVVEVDIVPSISIVKSKWYTVCLPNFNDATNKVKFGKESTLRRVGSKTEPVLDKDLSEFIQRVKDRDAQREEAERNQFHNAPMVSKDLGRKLKMLMTSGKKFIENDKWLIFVTNKFKPDDLCQIDWLLNTKIFCVFDFDPESKVSGLCNRYLQHHAANMHSLQSYRMPSDTSIKEFTSNLYLFEQTSWIFCNGRSDVKGNDTPCEEMTWIKTKITLLRDSVSLICKHILPKGAFQVIFLLTSPVEKPLLHTFYEFFTDMEGHEDIICICESEINFLRWQSYAEGSCGTETVNNFSVVGMKMSHVNATVQIVQPVKACTSKHLPVFVKGICLLETNKEEEMASLEILTVNHCDETTQHFISKEKANVEQEFFRGGRVSWLNFWLAEHKHVGEVIERDAYKDVSKLLKNALKYNAEQTPVKSITIYHHPGSGGSTVARQVLWKNRKDLRCAVVKPSYSAAVVAQHAVDLREYEEKDPQSCLPVLLLIEDSDKKYLDELRNQLEVVINSKHIQYGTLCFIFLSCSRSYDPERRCKESPLQNVPVTHKLSAEEKRMFVGKRKVLEEQYEHQFILTFVLMSEEFTEEYVQQFVKHLLQGIDHESAVTRLIHYVALLNSYVPNSFISQSHCEALLAFKMSMERFHQYEFERSLSDQAKLVFFHLRDDKTYIKSIRIIHPIVAKEILQQLLGSQQTHSGLAMKLLCENVLFQHRFGKEEYQSFLKALLITRSRISKGDKCDSFFSPLIEHVCKNEKPNKAIELLREAFKRFHDDPFFAQQLARLHYKYEMFKEAEHWAETAARQLPNNSYILDTKGQVHKKWFQAKWKAIVNDSEPNTAKNTADAVKTALKAMQCFQDCKRAATADMEKINNSGYFGEAEVGCNLLKLIFSLQLFANGARGHGECLRYLFSDYIPEELKDDWEPFHGCLKKLYKTVEDALEWISEDLSYFQTDTGVDEDEIHLSPEGKINNSLKWLANISSKFGRYLIDSSSRTFLQTGQSTATNLTPIQKRIVIYHLGGGNVTSILSKLGEEKGAVDTLKKILSLYPSNPLISKFDQREIVNYTLASITLNCLSPMAPKVLSLKVLQDLCRQFPADKNKCLPSSLFLLTLLFWPEDKDTNIERENKYEVVQSAVQNMEKGYWTKMKDIPPRKRRLYTHFFLGSGNGLDKFIHKRKFDGLVKGTSLSEKRMKWLSGEVWKKPEIEKLLKRVSGWTDDGVVYLEGPQKQKFRIMPLHLPSLPHSNENITFYLGFTFRGPVAYNIVVNK
ncbi:sterile alpha motif domain-containing protein 9-like [Platichthys flesus]|uniref:sterile alpha motif domain-containing protein 9-like n=1 Tax=Platichthys flesus TaxID=8260 RepID=UPI002DBC0657|nr:sterile alpha motif domain-containing protein 9-like [Platichthys flesus]